MSDTCRPWWHRPRCFVLINGGFIRAGRDTSAPLERDHPVPHPDVLTLAEDAQVNCQPNSAESGGSNEVRYTTACKCTSGTCLRVADSFGCVP
jgi:hypothetical protein